MIDLTHKDKDQWLRDIIQNNNVDGIENAIKLGAKVEARDDRNRTPLMFAAELGHDEVCIKLIECGADLEATDNDDATALSYAAMAGNNMTCKALLAAGANIEVESIDKLTPLALAAYFGHDDVCRTLIENRANIETLDNNEHTPLDKACEEGKERAGKVLLSYGATYRDREYANKVAGWLADMRKDVEILFPTSRVPSRSQCFGDDGKLDERVLFACATHQFGPLIGGALLGAKQYTLFEKIWEALPQHWRDNNQGLYIEYGKRTHGITQLGITHPHEGKVVL